MAWRSAGLFWFGQASLEPALVRKTQENRIERSRLETCDLAERIAVVPGARRLEQQCENAEGLRRRVWQPRHDILYICCLCDASPSRGLRSDSLGPHKSPIDLPAPELVSLS